MDNIKYSDSQEPRSVRSNMIHDRSCRSYLRHTKTSRMKSVNRRDQKLKESIKNETSSKFDQLLLKNVNKESMPPKPVYHNTSVSNTFERGSFMQHDLVKNKDEGLRCETSTKASMFKLESKTGMFDKRKGSRTNRNDSEPTENRFGFNVFENRRAEHKISRQKHINSSSNSNSNIPNIKSIERNVKERQTRMQKWENKLWKFEEKAKERIGLKESIGNNLLNISNPSVTCNNDQLILNDSITIKPENEEAKQYKPVSDVFECLNSQSSPTRTVSIIGTDTTNIQNKSIDFGNLFAPEVDSIYTLAGYSDKPIDTIEKYSCDWAEWLPISWPLKQSRTKFAVVSYVSIELDGTTCDKILIMGGKLESGKRTDMIHEYDPKTNTIWEFAHLPRPMSGFAAVCINNKVYIIGGNDGKIRSQVDCLDLDTKLWTSIASLNLRRDEVAATFGPDGWLYAIGGYGGAENKWLISTEKYSFKNKSWTILGSMNNPRRALSAVSLPNGVYAIGGYDGEHYLNTVERYDQDSNTWVSVAKMKQKRCTLSSVRSNDCRYIYSIGGFNGGALETVERYDVIDNKWEFIKSMKSKRFMHASVMIRQ